MKKLFYTLVACLLIGTIKAQTWFPEEAIYTLTIIEV